jgi:arabinofuranosyltransferase
MRSDRIMNTAAGLALLPLAWLVSRFAWTCDDAFISFRYVKHFARGDGLIFNPGEAPPVEGFTNLLWILVLTPFENLGFSLPLVANALSAGCALLLLVLLVRYLLSRGVGLWNAGACALVFVTLPPIGIWATSGLETMPFTLAVFATYMALAMGKGKSRIALAFVCAMAAALLRADGALWCGFAFIASLSSHATRGEDPSVRRASQWRAVLSTGVLLSIGVAVHFFWRHDYFGEWMPNTAKIKAGFSMIRGERGLKYIGSLALAAPAIALIPLLALPLLKSIRERAAYGIGALAFFALAAIYTVFTGGDFMAMGRFLVPALPFLIVLLAAIIEQFSKRGLVLLATTGLVATGLLGCFDLLNFSPGVRQALHFRWNREEPRTEVEQWEFMVNEVVSNRRLGRALALHTEPGERLIRGNVGAVGYFSELFLLDVNGLVIPEVAAASKPVERASPGHDRRVDSAFFRTWNPNYQFAIILPSNVPPRLGFQERWKKMLGRGKLELERIPLRVGDGFEAGTELRLLRDLRTAEESEGE